MLSLLDYNFFLSLAFVDTYRLPLFVRHWLMLKFCSLFKGTLLLFIIFSINVTFPSHSLLSLSSCMLYSRCILGFAHMVQLQDPLKPDPEIP